MTTPRLRYRRGQAAKRIDAEDAQIAYDFTMFPYTTVIEVGLTSSSRVTLKKVVVFAPEEKYIKLNIIVLNVYAGVVEVIRSGHYRSAETDKSRGFTRL